MKHLRGFTLVEVLVALAIAAIALAAIMRAAMQTTDTSIALRDRNQAMWIAQNQLAMHQLKRAWPSSKTTTGKTEIYEREWYWQQKVVSTPDPHFRRVEIEIRLEDGEHYVARLVGFLRNPEPAK